MCHFTLCVRGLVHSHPNQQFTGSVFLTIDVQIGTQQYLTMVLMYISIVHNDVEYLFMCLFAVCISSLMNCMFKSSAHLKNTVVCFLIAEFWELLIYCGYQFFIRYVIYKHFLLLSGLSFHFLTVPFEQHFLILDRKSVV